MIQITFEQAKRTEHVEDCCGWEDCDCFSARHYHRDVYNMQSRTAYLLELLGRARSHIVGDDDLIASIDAFQPNA